MRDYRVVALSVLAMAAGSFGAYLFANRHIEQTDNAIIRCDITDIVSQETGIIRAIHFADNQAVEIGDTLVEMDADVFLASRNRAVAELASAKVVLGAAEQEKALIEIDAQALVQKSRATAEAARLRVVASDYDVQQAGADLVLASAKLAAEEASLRRVRQLHAASFLSEKHLEDAQTSRDLAMATLKGLQAKQRSTSSRRQAEQSMINEAQAAYEQARQSLAGKLASAEAAVQTRLGQVRIAQAELELAEIKLSHTRIEARRRGMVTNRRVAVGEHIEVGQPVASITSCADEVWVEANFKETQIEKMRPGQAVTVEVDAYPGSMFRGSIESLSNGSGSMFSVLPPENATGNFTKVVQRFPVKISLEPSEKLQLRVGMSAVVSVDVSERPLAQRARPGDQH